MPRQVYDLLYAMDGDGDIDVDNNCDDFVYSLQMQCVYGGDGKFKLQGYQPLKKAEPQNRFNILIYFYISKKLPIT